MCTGYHSRAPRSRPPAGAPKASARGAVADANSGSVHAIWRCCSSTNPVASAEATESRNRTGSPAVCRGSPRRLFFLKTRDWETEFEYRFVLTAPDTDQVFAEYGDALEAVIVGEKFPQWQRLVRSSSAVTRAPSPRGSTGLCVGPFRSAFALDSNGAGERGSACGPFPHFSFSTSSSCYGFRWYGAC